MRARIDDLNDTVYWPRMASRQVGKTHHVYIQHFPNGPWWPLNICLTGGDGECLAHDAQLDMLMVGAQVTLTQE